MRYFKQISSDEIKLPSITGAGLLTLEEVKLGEAYIKNPVFHQGTPYWYLRTHGEDDETVFVMKGASIYDAVKTTFDDESDDWMFDFVTGCGKRPALYFSSSLSEVGANHGDRFEIGEFSFTIITDNIALCDSYIPVEFYIYNESVIQESIDTWFENDIKPFLS